MTAKAALLAFALVALAALAAGAGSNCDPARVAVAKLWVDKLNATSNAQKLTEILESIVTDDFTFTIKGVGSFTPKNVAIEYSVLIYPYLGVYPFSTSVHTYDDCAVYCDGDRIDLYHWGQSKFFPDANGVYNTTISGLRLFQRLEFAPGTNLIQRAFTANEKTYHNFFQFRPVNITEVCVWIQSQCTGSLQQYTDMNDCLTFMTQLSTYVTPCPFATVSNTLACRQLHALSSLINPTVHCPHVAKNSPVCVDSCLNDCAGNGPNGFCAANGRCVDAYVDFTQEHYTCVCKPGYIGNGFTTCAAQTCSTTNNQNSWQCPGQFSYSNCTGGLCGCADTFTWTGQTTNTCGCAANENVYWTNGVPQCILNGLCNERWQCPQSYSTVQCLPIDGNPTAKFKACTCNYGFCGGRESQCTCESPRRVVWSSVHNGQICITNTECTENYHCGSTGHCNLGSPVGTCA